MMDGKLRKYIIIITHYMVCARITGDRQVILSDRVIDAEGSYEELEIPLSQF
jgi:phospholipid/cholesterol/gamma-HCH transport system ATP-binding protein